MKIEYFASPEIKLLAQHSGHLGWFSESDWEYFVRTGVVFGHRLQSNEIVSSAYLVNYEDHVYWLGALIVNSRFQGKKLGRDLIQKALSIAPDHDFVMAVIATERGKRMYEQAGFIEIGNTHKFVADILPQPKEDLSVRQFDSNDLTAVMALDMQALGYRRTKVLQERLKLSLATFVFENEQNEIEGFAITSKEGERIAIGPIVATSFVSATALVKRVIENGGSFRLDAPHWQSTFIDALGPIGFHLERICPLLTYKGKALPRASDSYFAILSQAIS